MATTESLQPTRTAAPAILRAVEVLDAMARKRGPMTVSEVARATGLAKSSVSNLMSTLAVAGMVRPAGHGWLLGYRVLELGQSALASTDLVSEFHRLTLRNPVLREETVLIAVLDGLDVLYLARHNGNQPVRLATDIGHRLPAVVTSLGKAMLAGLPDDDLDARLAGVDHMPQLTPRSYRTLTELRADLAQVRRRGYAVDDEQNTRGITCYGVAIPGYRQPTAVSTTLLTSRVTPELHDRLIGSLQTLSRQLAGSPG